MIEINLAPPQLRKKRKRFGGWGGFNIPREIIVGFVGGFFVLLLMISVFLQVTIFTKFAQRRQLKKEWEEILPEKTQVAQVVSQFRALQGRVKSMESMLGSQNVQWSAALNDISNVLPRGVWLKSVSGNEQRLLLEGSSVSKGKDEMINVHEFASNLTGQKNFMDSWTDLEVGSIQRRTIKSVEIADFSITAKVKK